MVALLTGPSPVLLEPFPIIPVHSDALGHVQVIGDNMHFVLYVAQPSVLEPDMLERIVNHRQTLPVAAVWAALPLVIAKLADAAMLSAAEITRRLVLPQRHH